MTDLPAVHAQGPTKRYRSSTAVHGMGISVTAASMPTTECNRGGGKVVPA